VSSLVVKTFTKRFNDSYSTLLENQKQLLSNYISSFADNGLEFNFFLSEEIGRLKEVVTNAQNLEETQNDETIKENLLKVHDILENIKDEPMSKDVLYKVLQIQQLEKEIVS
jgi:DNA-binding protein H-NS